MRHPVSAWAALVVGLSHVSVAEAQWRAQPRHASAPRAVSPASDPADFNAVGTLVRNAGASGGRAPFALVDDSGIVQSYVYPTREGELDRLADRRIGVRGTSRTSARDGVPHVWAESAEELPGVRTAYREVEGQFPAEELPAPGGGGRFSGASRGTSIVQPSMPYDGPVEGGAYFDPSGSSGRVVYDPSMAYGQMPGSMMIDGQMVEGDPTMMGVMPEGAVMMDGPMVQGPYGPQGPMMMGPGGQPWGPAGYGRQGGFGWITGAWIRAEYLYWRTSGMNLPPLVTTSPTGTARADAGVLGEPGTTILFGGGTVNGDWRSGGRIRLGVWLDPRYVWGLEAEYFQLQDESTSFAATSPGSPILARPFFDVLNAQDSAELVAYPDTLSGTVLADATTGFHSAGLRGLYRICGHDACQGGPCGHGGCCQPQPAGCAYRVDFLLGYRYLRLDDNLTITEDLESLDPANPGSFVVNDAFDTENRFNGLELGTQWTMQRARWSLEVLTKMAIGVNLQKVNIAGSTAITEDGATVTSTGGLLAQRSNIGSYSQDEFSVVPELGLNLGYNLTPRLRAIVGYSLIYFPNVVRAGDQVDLDVNTNFLPPEADPFSGPMRPVFAFDTTDFWAHGFNVGLDYRF